MIGYHSDSWVSFYWIGNQMSVFAKVTCKIKQLEVGEVGEVGS